MFRCLECGKSFDEPLEIQDNLGTIKNPPYKVSYVCPHCKENYYKPFIKDSISRREVIDSLLDIMQALNKFDQALLSLIDNGSTKLDLARGKMFELFTILAGDSEFDLPRDIYEKVYTMNSDDDVVRLYDVLTKNIEA